MEITYLYVYNSLNFKSEFLKECCKWKIANFTYIKLINNTVVASMGSMGLVKPINFLGGFSNPSIISKILCKYKENSYFDIKS